MNAEHEGDWQITRDPNPAPSDPNAKPAPTTLHRAFFGDAERDFRLTPAMIAELERSTDCGIGALCQRLFAHAFRHRDIAETIRLALIGGGETPRRAAELVATYVEAFRFVKIKAAA